MTTSRYLADAEEAFDRHMRAEFQESDDYTQAVAEWAPQDPEVCAMFDRSDAYERAFRSWAGL